MKQPSLSAIAVLTLTILLIVPVHRAEAVFSIFSSHKKVAAADGRIEIPIAHVDDGKAHYFQHKVNDSTVKFFVVKSSDGVIRAAFDACDVCFPAKKGYSQDGDFMVCNNCGQRFHSSRINVVKGGCNPAPLTRQVVADNLVIRVEDVSSGARFF